MKHRRIGLLWKIVIAIVLGAVLGGFMPTPIVRAFASFNSVFSNFLGFSIPLIIVGLVAPGIAELGKEAGRLLFITAVLAYGFTLFSGFFTYFSCSAAYPYILDRSQELAAVDGAAVSDLAPYFTIEMPPLMGVMTALVLAFMVGIGVSLIRGEVIKRGLQEFREIVNRVISGVIIPLLPYYIFSIFLNMSAAGQVASIMSLFVKVIAIIFVLHITLLVVMYCIAAAVHKGNPFVFLRTMMPAYFTALGTQSSAATIPVTLAQTIKMGVNPQLAGFVVPLCATIHLSGSTMKITGCAMAIMYMLGIPYDLWMMAGFIMLLGITMVAAPGVPGGAIMAALGVLQSVLGFDQTMQALMIALYIAMDSFGTACNVTGDGAVALIMDKIYSRKRLSGDT